MEKDSQLKTETLPAAWMGYVAGDHQIWVRVCSYCQDRKQAEEMAKPLPVTHGVCPDCFQKQISEIIK